MIEPSEFDVGSASRFLHREKIVGGKLRFSKSSLELLKRERQPTTVHCVQSSEADPSRTRCHACSRNDSGIQLAGIDLIGNKVIEFNVFSTGGLYDANQFAGLDFADLIVRAL